MMITRRTHIRQQLRSARVSALTEDERRAEMRAAEGRTALAQEPDAVLPPEPGVDSKTPRVTGG